MDESGGGPRASGRPSGSRNDGPRPGGRPPLDPPVVVPEPPPTPGVYGSFGGAEGVPGLEKSLAELFDAADRALGDDAFEASYDELLRQFVGRGTMLAPAPALTSAARKGLDKSLGAKVWIKREDMALGGSGSAAAIAGQALLAARMGKKKLLFPAPSGEAACAAAAIAARLGLACDILVGSAYVDSQVDVLSRAQAMGGRIRVVDGGLGQFADVMDEALKAWEGVRDTALVMPAAIGPHPLPALVLEFESYIGRELKAQCLRLFTKLPDVVVAALGVTGGAAGVFRAFEGDAGVKLIGVEGGGRSSEAGAHAAPLALGATGVLHGMRTKLITDRVGQPLPAVSEAADLAYPACCPLIAYLQDQGRVRALPTGDAEAHEVRTLLAKGEGLWLSLASAHAAARAIDAAANMTAEQNVVVMSSGRDDGFEAFAGKP